MFKKRLKNPMFLFYGLVVYIMLQFGWWLYLIFTLYGEIYTDPVKLEKKVWMLLGEGTVFLIILILGVLIIRRAFKREKELNEQHENFLMSVSHELKTPISSVKLFLQTLKKRELDESKRNEIYSRSLEEVNRLDNLVGNILLTRNISNKNFYLNKVEIRLDEFIRKKVELLEQTFLQAHKIELNLEPVTLELDEEATDSILTNLIQNAAKYSPSEGKIEINLQKQKRGVVLRICDEGPGIPQDTKEKVFSKFYRIDNEMTRKSKGTGLGLYITRSLVEQHGASIALKDNQPKGLIVEIIFTS